MEGGAGGGEGTGGSTETTLFSVKEEPLDFDFKVEGHDLELNFQEEESVEQKPDLTLVAANNSDTTPTAVATAAVPQIGSSNSAFLPYKQQSLTILTNLQRGNVKTTNKENGPESLTFHEKAAKATLTDSDITEATVNAKDPNGLTPLMWAAFHGRLQIVQKLIEKGAQLDVYGPDGETALMFAACNGHTPVLNYLLCQGAPADTEDDAGNTALMFAAYGNHGECATLLLRRGANMSKPNGIGDTPFEIAINKGHLAAQYAMEDHLKEQLELQLAAALSSSPPATPSKSKSNLNSSTSTSTSATTTMSNGSSSNCNNNANAATTSIVLISNNCNGSGVENGSALAFAPQPSSS